MDNNDVDQTADTQARLCCLNNTLGRVSHAVNQMNNIMI